MNNVTLFILTLAMVLAPYSKASADETEPRVGNPATALLNAFGAGCTYGDTEVLQQAQQHGQSLADILQGIGQDEGCARFSSFYKNYESEILELKQNEHAYKADRQQIELLIEDLELAIITEESSPTPDTEFIASAKFEVKELRGRLIRERRLTSHYRDQQAVYRVKRLQTLTSNLVESILQSDSCPQATDAVGQIAAHGFGIASLVTGGLTGAIFLSAGAALVDFLRVLSEKDYKDALKEIESIQLVHATGCALEGMAATHCRARDVINVMNLEMAARRVPVACDATYLGTHLVTQGFQNFIAWYSKTEGAQAQDKIDRALIGYNFKAIEGYFERGIKTLRENLKAGKIPAREGLTAEQTAILQFIGGLTQDDYAFTDSGTAAGQFAGQVFPGAEKCGPVVFYLTNGTSRTPGTVSADSRISVSQIEDPIGYHCLGADWKNDSKYSIPQNFEALESLNARVVEAYKTAVRPRLEFLSDVNYLELFGDLVAEKSGQPSILEVLRNTNVFLTYVLKDLIERRRAIKNDRSDEAQELNLEIKRVALMINKARKVQLAAESGLKDASVTSQEEYIAQKVATELAGDRGITGEVEGEAATTLGLPLDVILTEIGRGPIDFNDINAVIAGISANESVQMETQKKAVNDIRAILGDDEQDFYSDLYDIYRNHYRRISETGYLNRNPGVWLMLRLSFENGLGTIAKFARSQQADKAGPHMAINYVRASLESFAKSDFGDRMDEIVAKMQEESRRSESARETFALYCMQIAQMPSIPGYAMEACKGAVWSRGAPEELRFDDWKTKRYEDRVCSIFDMRRKVEVRAKTSQFGSQREESSISPTVQRAVYNADFSGADSAAAEAVLEISNLQDLQQQCLRQSRGTLSCVWSDSYSGVTKVTLKTNCLCTDNGR